MGLQSIGAAQLVAAQPIGTSAIRFSGYSSIGGYTYTTSIPSGNYLFYPVGRSSSNEYAVKATDNGKTYSIAHNSTALIKLTTSETNFNIVQYTNYSRTDILTTGDNWWSAAYGNGTYVLGGDNGGIRTSTNGTTWTSRNGSWLVSGTLQALVYGNNIFVGGSSGGHVATSTDGITWTTRKTMIFGVNAITYGNGIYIAGGSSGYIQTSTDAITWTSRNANTGETIYAATYGNSLYVIAGGIGMLRTSTDGITWTSRTSAFGTSTIYALTYFNGLYIAGGDNGAIRTSSNGATWTTRISTFGTGDAVRTFVNIGGALLAAGGDSLRSSTDGITWTTRVQPYPTGYGILAGTVGDTIVFTGGGGYGINSANESQFALYDASSSATLN